MTTHYDVLIVGAGHAGAHAATSLRQHKFAGSIAMVGDESDLPYDRPSLSKDYLTGERGPERILLRPAAFWAERDITLKTGTRVVSVDALNHTVTTSDQTALHYGSLIWATGGRPRQLSCSGHNLPGVHVIRHRSDVDRLKSELDSTQSVAIIGGGYIGLEAAAGMCKLGKKATVIEALDRVLARVAGEPLSRFYEAEHRAHGVNILLNAKVDCIEEQNGRASGVRLTTGEIIPAELVIVGIGIVPTVEPLLAAGATGNNGVAVDEFCRTSLADIYAIGDCALHNNAFANGSFIRLESVQNATDMAATTAKAISGALEAYRAVPWFWSNQFDLRLQTVGLSQGYDQIVVRGDMAARSFSLIYCKAGHVIALDCVNATKDYVQGRALVQHRAQVEPNILADTTKPLKPAT